MRLAFESQLKPFVGEGRSEPPPHDPSRNPSLSTPHALDGKTTLDRMMERNAEHAFLKLLIAQDTSKEAVSCRIA